MIFVCWPGAKTTSEDYQYIDPFYSGPWSLELFEKSAFIMTILPYHKKDGTKKSEVTAMFNQISGKYDFLNRFLSAGIDKNWRKRAINLLKDKKIELLLDIATGTGDLAFEAMRLHPEKIVGIDISNGMLEIARKKAIRKGYNGKVEFFEGDSENLLFENNKFDAITVGFGVRNFENLEKGLREMYRVLKPGGVSIILEFSKPDRFPLRELYQFYFRNILPVAGGLISGDKSAYQYLPDSVNAFPQGIIFEKILADCGFEEIVSSRLTFGVATIYYSKKK